MLTRAVLVSFALFAPLAAQAADDPAPSSNSPDGRTAIAVGEAIRVVDSASGKVLIEIKAHTGKVTAIGYSPDGKLLASGGDDKTVRIFDSATGKAILALKGHAAGVAVLAFSPDGKTLTTIDKDKKTIKWNPATGEQVP